ncbi:MAG: thymidine phosphorylase [Christensenellaceae bacterium]|jgi:pyrimidine-nucleoside phosphorylase|nr:thymidine phosphorylase [Christensenellaceae bacterium]
MEPVNMVEIIRKKRDGEALLGEEIAWFVRALCAGSIPDYQVSALLMAIFLRGMNGEETAALTLEMAKSGGMADLSAVPGLKVDKHSTGGVGDLTTLVALPLAAACGAKVAKMSGRALGHTGGTLDKLWSIPGFRTNLSEGEFTAQLNQIGCALIGQSEALAPADKILYALRDVSATVESLPLIVSSILSKKIAAGADAIVLDVKTGSGALMKGFEDSMALAEEMVKIGKLAGRRMLALVTDMDEPLGRSIGNALEIREAVAILKGEEEGRAAELCLRIAAAMLALALDLAEDEALKRVRAALEEGRGLLKLREWVAAQGGNPAAIDDPSLLPGARVRREVKSLQSGFITAIDARALGLAAGALGAARETKEAAVDYGVGLELLRQRGDAVRAGEALAAVYAQSEEAALRCEGDILAAIQIGEDEPRPRPLIFARFERKAPPKHSILPSFQKINPFPGFSC